MFRTPRTISWVKGARRNFERFPKGAREKILQALELAAEGRKADSVKPMKGLGSGVFEIALKYRTDAYRTVFAVQLDEVIWVVHAFQKKAKAEINLVRERLQRLKEMLE